MFLARTRPRLLALTLSALSLATNGCGGRTTLPTWCQAGENCVDALMLDAPKGTLRETQGCIWLAADGNEYRVYWPAGYTAQTTPLVVFNAHGVPVAKEGDEIAFALRDAGDTDSCGHSGSVVVSFGDIPEAT